MYTWDILVAHMLSVILHFGTKNVFVLFKMLVIKPRASCILDKCFATELKIMEAEPSLLSTY